MENNYVIAEEASQKMEEAISNGRNWIAYDSNKSFLENDSIEIFRTKGDAISYSALIKENEGAEYRIFHADSMADVYRKIPYSENLSFRQTKDPDANGLHSTEGNAFTDAWIDHIEKQQKITNNLKHNVMNEENLDFLQKKILYTGFGDKLNTELKEQMQQLKPEFALEHKAKFGEEEINAKLHFRKSDTSDFYFFNKYDMSLKLAGEHGDRSQTFYMDKGHGNITAKEAYNLLSGRAVHKELTNKDNQTYYAWQQINFELKDKHDNHLYKQFHQNYGFDLSEALGKHAIKEMENPNSRDMLIKSLEKGNLQSVTFNQDGNAVKGFIEANPQNRSINVYDGEMKLQQQHTQKQMNGQSVSKEVKQDEKQDKKEEQKQDLKEDKKKGQAVAKSDDLEKKKSKSKSRSH